MDEQDTKTLTDLKKVKLFELGVIAGGNNNYSASPDSENVPYYSAFMERAGGGGHIICIIFFTLNWQTELLHLFN